jgi:hypothetical protein
VKRLGGEAAPQTPARMRPAAALNHPYPPPPGKVAPGGLGGWLHPPNLSLIWVWGGWLHPPKFAALAYRRLVDKDDRGQAGQCPEDPNDHTTNRNEEL